MTHELAIGDRTYSSWSLRGWLAFAGFNIPLTTRKARMYSPEFAALLADFAPARLVPAARINGTVVWDTLAIAETLAELYPEKHLWPAAPTARAHARAIVAEMHSGFVALRSACTMNLRHSYAGFTPKAEVLADVARVEQLWESCAAHDESGGGWLFGHYSLADVFYAPVATRIATYNLPVGPRAQTYVAKSLAFPAFRRWRAMGLAEGFVQPGYDLDLPSSPWPGPTPLAARAVEGKAAINTLCPYSGKPVAANALLEIDGQVIGFCNPFCRDKTLHDPEAWPETMALLTGR
ncbi:glutathione S-transferase [Abyssibius alkaniclasticus]|uniref:glutathione S-transferase n=1 Tax=Abyssibius alkaniclasticus TaxID=2881234 RepID=UPI0023632FEB|nr:glutathione S-transferase [Abyssibius alkaniclasticus]UPH72161.1 glutathione S-transferase [Abyssibius alkaniclasticus]